MQALSKEHPVPPSGGPTKGMGGHGAKEGGGEGADRGVELEEKAPGGEVIQE